MVLAYCNDETLQNVLLSSWLSLILQFLNALLLFEPRHENIRIHHEFTCRIGNSCTPGKKIQVNPRFWLGLEILF